MTTKFEHLINPLTRAPHNFAAHTLIIHQFHRHQEGGLHLQKSSSMDRTFESQKIDSMKMMMLMQEQVFKQQVQELHRLYNMQKKLMQEVKKELKLRKETAEMGETTKSELAIRHQTTSETMQSFKASSARNYQNELSRSNSAENRREPIKFDLEMPAETESTPSSSIHQFAEQNGLKNMDEEGDVEVELTLSLGHCTRKKRSKSQLHHYSTHLQDSDQPNKSKELGSSSTKTVKGEAYDQPNSINRSSSSVYQENTRPHWLLRDLNLNRT